MTSGPVKFTVLTFRMSKSFRIQVHLLDTSETQKAMAAESVGEGMREGSARDPGPLGLEEQYLKDLGEFL